MLTKEYFEGMADFERHYAHNEDRLEAPSPFLTDRETAELTLAVAVPFALAAFEPEKRLGVAVNERVVQDAPAKTHSEYDELDLELLQVLREESKGHIARRAILYSRDQLDLAA